MSDRKPSPFKTLLDSDKCTLIQATDDVYQIRFKNRAANAYLVRGKSRTIMIDVGLSSNFAQLKQCLDHLGCPPDQIDVVILSHEHLDHIGEPRGIIGGDLGLRDRPPGTQEAAGLGVDLLKGEQRFPRVAVLRTMIMNHLIHHRAQLGVYFRLVGVPVPGLYGPSADEQ